MRWIGRADGEGSAKWADVLDRAERSGLLDEDRSLSAYELASLARIRELAAIEENLDALRKAVSI
jgi:hypothetical protein